jgi:hypothetical protein
MNLIPYSSQALTYGICSNELGERLVHKYEGREHSGRKFNEIALDYQSEKHFIFIDDGYLTC